MYSVDLYSRVRRACHVEGMSKSAAARQFGLDRKTVAKMPEHTVPPGYRGRALRCGPSLIRSSRLSTRSSKRTKAG